MGSRRRRSVYEILGGGLLADLILWRRRNDTAGIVAAIFSAWVVFELCGYTVVSLVSRVLLLLVTILFLWAKAAGILNRSLPAIPELHIPEEATKEAAEFLRTKLNITLSISRNVALGRDSNLFCKVSACLLLVSIISSWTDFRTMAYASLAVVFTVPVLYEMYEDTIDKYLDLTIAKLKLLYVKLNESCIRKVKEFGVEKSKLS